MSWERYGIIIPNAEYTLLFAPNKEEIIKFEELITLRHEKGLDIVITQDMQCLRCIKHPGLCLSRIENSVRKGVQEVFPLIDGTVVFDDITYFSTPVAHSPNEIILGDTDLRWYKHRHDDTKVYYNGSIDHVDFLTQYKKYTETNTRLELVDIPASQALWTYLLNCYENRITMQHVGKMICNPYASGPNCFFKIVQETVIEYITYPHHPNHIFEERLSTVKIDPSTIKNALADLAAGSVQKPICPGI